MSNKKENVENSGEFSIIFGGDASIDTELFLKSIKNIKILMAESSKATGIDSSFRLDIKATKEGSFDILLNLIVEHPPLDTIASVGETIRLVFDWFQYKQFLKGTREKSRQVSDNGSMVNIENQYGDTNIYNGTVINNYNYTVDKEISDLCNNANTNGRESVLLKSKKDSIEVPRNNLEEMANKVVDVPKNKKIKKTKLSIRKPDLLKDSKWLFEFDGKSIDATVIDPNFLKKIRNGSVTFSAGMQINCILQVEDKISRKGEIIDEYTVVKVIGKPFKSKKPSQDELF